jgi:hypothetical protein
MKRKEASEGALNVARRFIEVIDDPNERDLPYCVSVGGNYTEFGVSELFKSERTANRTALELIYALAHLIDAECARIKETEHEREQA